MTSTYTSRKVTTQFIFCSSNIPLHTSDCDFPCLKKRQLNQKVQRLSQTAIAQSISKLQRDTFLLFLTPGQRLQDPHKAHSASFPAQYQTALSISNTLHLSFQPHMHLKTRWTKRLSCQRLQSCLGRREGADRAARPAGAFHLVPPRAGATC